MIKARQFFFSFELYLLSRNRDKALMVNRRISCFSIPHGKGLEMVLHRVRQLRTFLIIDKNFGVGQTIVTILAVGQVRLGGHPVSSRCTFALFFPILAFLGVQLEILIANLDKFGIDAFASRFGWVKCELNPAHLRETTLQLGVLRHPVF